jgi:pimeloyl-ACP methyl ester carboxylesterase
LEEHNVMQANDFLPFNNRTTVRTRPWSACAVTAGLRAVSTRSPAAAATIGEALMFRTTRRPARADEREVLARGEPLRVDSASRIAAWSWGDGPVVTLVHGWNGRASQLVPLIDPLVARGFRVVAFDAPGHGESPGWSSSLPQFADALDAVLESVRPLFGRIHAVVAHSMGAAATTYAMSRWAEGPSGALEGSLAESSALPCARFAFVAPPIDPREFVRAFASTVGFDEATVSRLRRRVERRFALPLESLYAPALARKLDAPLLVVHDEEDREVPLRAGQALAAAWPGARLHVTHGLGHVRILRDPGVVARIVDFVARPVEPAP